MKLYNLSLNQAEFDYLLDLIQNSHSSVSSALRRGKSKSVKLRNCYSLSFMLLLKLNKLFDIEVLD